MIRAIVTQHIEDAEIMAEQRVHFVRRPNVTLRHLARFDSRLAANIEGIGLAGKTGRELLRARIDDDGPAALLPLGVLDLESGDSRRIDEFIALATKDIRMAQVASTALGWVGSARAACVRVEKRGGGKGLAATVALSAWRLHGIDPGSALIEAIRQDDPQVRSAAYETAGAIGRRDLLSFCGIATADANPDTRFWAAWAAVLLGERSRALRVMTHVSHDSAHYSPSFQLSIQAMSQDDTHAELERLAHDRTRLRWLIRGCGIAGNPRYGSWLINQMAANDTARVAGEALTVMTGVDLTHPDLEREAPESFSSGADDDPDCHDVAMDEDDGLPWPDPDKVHRWWEANQSRFMPGQRYFMGAPVTREHCIEVLKNGYQRQRILAAQYLCLLEPGTPLFNTSAPAWRQQRLLAQMK